MSLSRLGVLVKTIKAFRGVLVALFFMVILLPVAVYVLMSSSWACDKIRDIGQQELSALFGTTVSIGDVKFSPFNRMAIYDVSINDDNDSTALVAKEIDTRFEIWDLLFKRKIIIDYATINGLDLHLYRDSVSTPLNIDGIIKRLSKSEPDKEPTMFKLRLNDLNLGDCRFSYDVRSVDNTPGRFNVSHVAVDSLRLSAFAPIISNDSYTVRLRSLSFVEQSGFKLKNLTTKVILTEDSIQIASLGLALPNSLLTFADLNASIDGFSGVNKLFVSTPLDISINDGSHVYLPDLKAFAPALGDFDYDIDLALDSRCSLDTIDVQRLELDDPNDIFCAKFKGLISGYTDIDKISINGADFDLRTNPRAINSVLNNANLTLKPKVRELLGSLGSASVKGSASGTVRDGNLDITVNSGLASAVINGKISHPKHSAQYVVNGKVDVDSLKLGMILGDTDFNSLSASADVQGIFDHKTFSGDAMASVAYVDYKGYRYRNIDGEIAVSDRRVTAALDVDDPNFKAKFDGDMYADDDVKALVADLKISKFRPDTLNLTTAYPGYNLSGDLHVNGAGESIDRFKGNVTIDNLYFYDSQGNGIGMKNFDLFADNVSSSGRIAVSSDYLNGTIDGSYHFSTLKTDIRHLYETLIPALGRPEHDLGYTDDDEYVNDVNISVDYDQSANKVAGDSLSLNKFSVDLTLSNCEKLCDFFKLPVVPIAESSIRGSFDGVEQSLFITIDIPWIESGNSFIQYTNAVVNLNAAEDKGSMFLTSYIPTKKGNMDIEANVYLNSGVLDTNIYWSLMPEKPISGNIDFTTDFERDADESLITNVRFNPGNVNFGDEIWDIQKSYISVGGGKATINGFALLSQNQSLRVDGVLGDSEADRLVVDLNNIQLIDIFETLDIGAVLISGYATGRITADALLSKSPIVNCKRLAVRSIGYNYCTLGDALVKLSVDDGGKLFKFSADITEDMGKMSYLSGYIEPSTESLELNIDADHVNVGFLQPFMHTFTSDISGQASGRARLFGTFKDIDLEGDIDVDSLRIKIDFTNTYYYASDPIKIRPGMIDLPNITIRDEYGNKALLNGWVTHRYFHDAAFEFKVTNARNLLSYDITEKQNSKWYGRVFADGSVTVKGRPGLVDIGINMTTAANSTFTLVLSDKAVADEYSFISFRDLTPKQEPDSILDRKFIPDKVRKRASNAAEDSGSSSDYNIDITVGVTPQAQINILMDPVGGDRIRSNGSGSIRLYYGSANNDLRLYGTYTLERGNYNFTLQDLIIKDFTIKSGSYVTFTGDPYAADVDIEAYYQVNANLSDLDESFLQDKELNRTNVPVRALMIVKGDIRQPSITFDLELPTLTQDTYRKVKSIVSTEDMMNKQIIYLLALNRFYTPEYMGATTKGNELFSVASSTLSSQLSNMLGKLSENWSIAPNLRSDRGDFSDLEVDVILSSSLLNNRLLFNGNFGYRDKSLNTNQFIGDFDVEYLLNRSGEWRLKAYNRYNDQNYYLRTAQTTQGVGIVYRRDFDRTFKIFDRLFGKKQDEDSLKHQVIEHLIDETHPIDSLSTDTITPLPLTTSGSTGF